MERRNLLKTVGGIGATATIGGLGLLAAAGGASATGGADYEPVTVTSDDGTVDYVAIYGDSVVEWDGFESTAVEAQIVTEASVSGQSDWTLLYDTGRFDLSNDDWGGANEELSGPGTSGTIETAIGLDSDGNYDESTAWTIVGDGLNGYGLPQNSIDSSLLEADGDGDTANFTVTVRATYTWYDSDGNELLSESFTSDVPVTVNNEERTTSGASGDGESGAVGS